VASNIGTVNAKYRKPPIIERALAVHVDMAEEKFRLKAETWPQIDGERMWREWPVNK